MQLQFSILFFEFLVVHLILLNQELFSYAATVFFVGMNSAQVYCGRVMSKSRLVNTTDFYEEGRVLT